MSFKDGIPLLAPFDDEEESEDDFTLSTLPHAPRRVNKRHVCFCLVLVGALCLLLALVVGVAVPVALVKQAGGNNDNGPDTSTSVYRFSSKQTQPTLATSAVTDSTSTPVESSSALATPTPSRSSTHLPSSVPSSEYTSSTVMASSSALSSSSVQISFSTSSTTSPSVLVTSRATPTPSRSSALQSSVLPTPTPIPLPYNFYQAKSDQRDYDFIQLSNQLRILLISDPSTVTSGASMDVGTGSFDDPDQFLGLAHFCEHMLFLGTEKFPSDGEYSEYLKQHGGYDNAFTSTEHTNYYFTVQSPYLEQALDRFSQFFIAPLLTESLVNKEVNAVNSEHEKNLLSDSWRLWQMLKEVSNPKYPLHKFSTGSLETLDHPGLWANVSAFYHSMYSANRMQLVIYGMEDTWTLRDWARQYFNNITNQHLARPQYDPSGSFSPPFNSRVVFYYPVADFNQLILYWQVPSQEKLYRHAITGFITRYLGQETSGSLALYLKSEGLVTRLSAGVAVETEDYTLMEVDMDLTDEGLSGVSHVIQGVYAYIDLLRGLNETQFEMRFEDYVRVQQTVFDYSQQTTPRSSTTDTASRMRTVSEPQDFLGSPERFLPNHALFLSVLGAMTPVNSNVFLISKSFNISPELSNKTGFSSTGNPVRSPSHGFPWPLELTRCEPVYKSPYDFRGFNEQLLGYWNSASHSDFPELSLPDFNTYIPEDLVVMDSAIAPRIGILAGDDDPVVFWWIEDTKDYPEPRVNLYCQLRNPDAQPSLQREAMTRLYAAWVNEELSTRLYSASEVGIEFQVSAEPRGVTLSISGFSQHEDIRSILANLIDTLLLTNMTEGLFAISKLSTIDDLVNYNYTTLPFRYTPGYIQKVILERPYWKHWQVLEEMRNLTMANLEAFSAVLLSNLSVDCFANGNVNNTIAQSYEDVLKQGLGDSLYRHVTPMGYSPQRIQLAAGARVAVVMETLNRADQNSVVNELFQVGELCVVDNASNCSRDSLLTRLHLTLLDQIISNECFHTLRTVQQLGYVASCYSRNYQGIGSFQVLVQSKDFDASVVYNRIREFLVDYYDSTINQPSFNETFATEVDVLKTSLREKDPTLTDRSDRIWSLISSGVNEFDYREQLVRVIDEQSDDFTVDTLRKFYQDTILNADSAKELLTVMYGENKPFTAPDGYQVVDYEQLDQTALHLP